MLFVVASVWRLYGSCKVQVFEGEDAKEKGTEGKSRGFGFVNFEDHASAVKAVEALNGKVGATACRFCMVNM